MVCMKKTLASVLIGVLAAGTTLGTVTTADAAGFVHGGGGFVRAGGGRYAHAGYRGGAAWGGYRGGAAWGGGYRGAAWGGGYRAGYWRGGYWGPGVGAAVATGAVVGAAGVAAASTAYARPCAAYYPYYPATYCGPY